MADDSQRPIIIKKIKKAGHGHHGGAWKVAYADFVTAMMAFFLLLWLVSSSEEETLQGLAEYFTPTVGIKDSSGIGVEGGLASIEDGTQKNELSAPGIVVGQTPQGPIPDVPEKQAQKEGEADAYLFEKAEEAIKQALESDPNLRDLSDNVVVEQTPEGLKIDVVDSDKNPMFTAGNATLSQFGKRILGGMLGIIEKMPNFISITGHTDASPLGKRKDYTNWELSADRANAARRYLLSRGLDAERTKKVQGNAATDLLVPENPIDPKNRRISIILLRGSHLVVHDEDLPATRDLLSVPGVGPSRLGKETPKQIDAKPPVAPEKETPENVIAPDSGAVDTQSVPAVAPSAPSLPAQPLSQPALPSESPIPAAPSILSKEPVSSLPNAPAATPQSPIKPIESIAPAPIDLTDEELKEFIE